MNKKKKRKKSLSNNPLSDARKAGLLITADLPKAEAKAAALWHLKCNSGCFLFLSYYAKQPFGVVVDVDVSGQDEEGNETSAGHNNNSTIARTAGQSRAAKRRRRKKFKNDGSVVEGDIFSSLKSVDSLKKSSEIIGDNDDNAVPILRAFHRIRRSCQNLTPFVEALSRPLPLTFRLRHLSSQQNQRHALVNELLSNHSHLVRPVIYDSTVYQSFCSTCHKKNVEPALHKILMEASASGLIARQEIGSMLPVSALISGGWLTKKSTVLDMCASPGSKTLQAFEISKYIVANEIHPTRLEALKSAVERSGLKSSKGLTYTQFDASVFPCQKRFDVVIADVPCSGDGTVRKDPRALSLWNPHAATLLHSLQVRILEQALRVVKVEGMVSYSTCSFNPIENEAVVAAVLRKFSTAVEVVEWPDNSFPGLIRRSGVSDWLVADCTSSATTGDENQEEETNPVVLRWYDSYNDAVNAGMENVVETLWPPNSDETPNFRLHTCTRLWPQDQDTGGFFVSLLKKKRDIN